MRLKWYRKHMRPWGYSIGYFDEAFPTIRGTGRRISKHFTSGGRFTFFAFERKAPAHEGDRYVCRARTLQRLLTELERDTN